MFLKAVKTVEMFEKAYLYFFLGMYHISVVLLPLHGGVCRRHYPGMQFGITEAHFHAIET